MNTKVCSSCEVEKLLPEQLGIGAQNVTSR